MNVVGTAGSYTVTWRIYLIVNVIVAGRQLHSGSYDVVMAGMQAVSFRLIYFISGNECSSGS
jgi:hypothetical protein